MLKLSRTVRATALTLGTLGFVGVPAASAAEVVVPGKCYVTVPGTGSQIIPVTVTGLAPSQNVQLSLLVKDRVVSGIPSLTADATGGIISSIDGWTSGLGTGPTRSTKASVVVSDLATGAAVGQTDFKVSNVGFKVDGAFKRGNVKRVWEISGLASLTESQGGGKVYYAHYFKGSKKVGKQRLGKSTDACGYIRVKKPLLPFRKRGSFKVVVQASTVYNPDLFSVGGTVTAS
ncbi:MAG: hypothetical protein JHD16_07565 [Solirubrobacteraceae bacterium]|nr:hypothetical protein [Solirubrobacteraceae bacterium]